MAGLYFLIVLCIAVVFIFKNGVIFALSFLAVTMIPCIAIAAAKWGVMRGDAQQKLFVPVVALLLLAFAYWLSPGVSVNVASVHLSGFVLMLIGGFVGLVGVPLRWAEQA